MAMDLTPKVLALEAFADGASTKITRLEQELAKLERRLQEAETKIRRRKDKAKA